MTFQEYKQAVFDELKKSYVHFKEETDENKAYLLSEDVEKDLNEYFKNGTRAESAAYFIDLCY